MLGHVLPPYFHVGFTLPHQLNPLIYCNQKLLYGLLHRCCAETLLELSADKKWLVATLGIIQVLHTWNQELDYHFRAVYLLNKLFFFCSESDTFLKNYNMISSVFNFLMLLYQNALDNCIYVSFSILSRFASNGWPLVPAVFLPTTTASVYIFITKRICHEVPAPSFSLPGSHRNLQDHSSILMYYPSSPAALFYKLLLYSFRCSMQHLILCILSGLSFVSYVIKRFFPGIISFSS